MTIWAIADLHLSFGVANKEMGIFGSHWENHAEKISKSWSTVVLPNDLVLIPGDISWAMTAAEVKPDLDWIDRLPGTKVLLKGNHDYWWGSVSKVKSLLPPSCHIIQNGSFFWNGVSIAGSRLWDTPEYSFGNIIERTYENQQKPGLTHTDHSEDKEKIFQRELGRLELSLQSMNPQAVVRIAMTHYPSIGLDLKDSRVSRLLEKYGVNQCVFGHLHNVKPGQSIFGDHHGINYHLVACDFLNFTPLKILG